MAFRGEGPRRLRRLGCLLDQRRLGLGVRAHCRLARYACANETMRCIVCLGAVQLLGAPPRHAGSLRDPWDFEEVSRSLRTEVVTNMESMCVRLCVLGRVQCMTMRFR